jgi:phage gpG-like protein
MIKIDFKVPNLAKKFKEMQPEVVLLLAATMQTNRAMMFDKDGADNGKKAWEPINPLFRVGRPLQDSGDLRKSMGPVNDGVKPNLGPGGILEMHGDEVKIGTTLAYAGVMNDGTTKMPDGVIKVKNAMALKIPKADGTFMFRHSVKIPARRMDEITQEDKEEWSETLANFVAERLNG